MTQFDLEQQILDCWGIVDDVKCLRKTGDSGPMNPDMVDNYLLGLQTIYQVKFEQLFETFEKFLKEYYNLKKPKVM